MQVNLIASLSWFWGPNFYARINTGMVVHFLVTIDAFRSINSRIQLNFLSRTCFCSLTCKFKPLHSLHKAQATMPIRDIVELELIPARYTANGQLHHHLQIVWFRSLLRNLEQYQTVDEIIFVVPYFHTTNSSMRGTCADIHASQAKKVKCKKCMNKSTLTIEEL